MPESKLSHRPLSDNGFYETTATIRAKHTASLKNHFKYTLLFRKDNQIDSEDLFLSTKCVVLQTRVLVRETLEEANKFERLPKSMSECQTMFLSTKCVVFAEGYGLIFVETSDDVGACIRSA